MNLKTTLKDSLFVKSFNLAKSNPSKAGLMVLFDASFFISFYYILPILARYFAQNLVVSQTTTFLITLNILALLYLLLALLIYSFFKYSILDFVKSLFGKTDFSFKRLGQFYIMNIIIFLPIYILFSLTLENIKIQYQPFVFFFLGVPLSLILYIITNISHSLFYQGNSVINSLKKSFTITFAKIKSYRETIFAMILFALILGLLFIGSGYLIRLLASKNYTLYLNTYAYFKQASVIVFDLVFYFVILINRTSFYAITREIK